MGISNKLKLDKSSGVKVEEGSHIGVLCGIVHLGYQNVTYKGETSIKDQALLQFEIQDVLTEGGDPVIRGKVVTNSMKQKSTMLELAKAYQVKDLENGVDFEELVGKGVSLNFALKEDKSGTVIKDFSPLHNALKSSVKPLSTTPTVLLDVEQITDAQLKELPEFIQKMINNRVRDVNQSTDSSSSVDL